MKAYLVTTSVIFALITVAHIARVFAESTRVLHDPWFVVMTLLSVGLFAWAMRFLARKPA